MRRVTKKSRPRCQVGAIGETFYRIQEECFPLPEKGQGHWFGGLGPEHSFVFPPPWLTKVRMTAIAISYTSFGFAIAADGRQQWQHAATRDNAARGAESDEVQKIFQIQRRDATFAFTLSGDTANRDRSFDLCTEVRNQVTQLQKTRFFTPGGFVETLSEYVTAAIQTARNEHRIEDYPQSEITLAGYFDSTPCLVNIQFERYGRSLRHRTIFQQLQPGACFLTGSHLIAAMVSRGDERFAQLCTPLGEDPSLQTATEFAIGYIRASSTALARSLDPECDRIGGHIHAAVVTPPDRSLRATFRRWLGRGPGPQTCFQWIRPPLLSWSNRA